MDKIFGFGNLVSEIVWSYGSASGGRAAGSKPVKGHDTILWYAGDYGQHTYNRQFTDYSEKYIRERFTNVDADGRTYRTRKRANGVVTRQYLDESPGVPLSSVWSDVKQLYAYHWMKRKQEEVGYPTQKPEALIERIIRVSSNEGDVVLDAFLGGGTTAVVAQRLGRRWIAMDQSRVAVAVAAERLKAQALTRGLEDPAIPDFTIEHWGVYEAERLSQMPPKQFRAFVLGCYDARIPSEDEGIHGYKGAQARVPVWVGEPAQRSPVSAGDVNEFAQAIARLDRYQGDEGLRDGIMLAWGFRPDARRAAEELRERERISLAFVRLDQVELDSPAFRRHIASQSTERGDYSQFLTFVEPPDVSVSHRRLKGLHYEFDASDTQTSNAGAQLVNVQWDFDYDGRTFRAARGEWFHRRGKGKNAAPVLDAQHAFPRAGTFRVACRVQDDKGGEGHVRLRHGRELRGGGGAERLRPPRDRLRGLARGRPHGLAARDAGVPALSRRPEGRAAAEAGRAVGSPVGGAAARDLRTRGGGAHVLGGRRAAQRRHRRRQDGADRRDDGLAAPRLRRAALPHPLPQPDRARPP